MNSAINAVNADCLDGLDSSNFVLADDLTNVATLDGGQTFTGVNTFSQGVSLSENWDVANGDFDGVSEILGLYQDGFLRMAIAPNGAADENGNDAGVAMFGDCEIADGGLYIQD